MACVLELLSNSSRTQCRRVFRKRLQRTKRQLDPPRRKRKTKPRFHADNKAKAAGRFKLPPSIQPEAYSCRQPSVNAQIKNPGARQHRLLKDGRSWNDCATRCLPSLNRMKGARPRRVKGTACPPDGIHLAPTQSRRFENPHSSARGCRHCRQNPPPPELPALLEKCLIY